MQLSYAFSPNAIKFNTNAPLYFGGVLDLSPRLTSVTQQTLGSNLSLLAGTTSAITTVNASAAPATTVFNLSGATGGIVRTVGSALAVAYTDSTVPLHVGSATSNSSTDMLGGWATIGSIVTLNGTINSVYRSLLYNVTDWAGLDGSNNIVSYTSLGGTYATNTWSSGSNTDITNASNSFSGTTNSLRFNPNIGAGTYTINLAAGTNTISSGCIMLPTNSANGASVDGVITGGSLTSGNGQDLIVNNFNYHTTTSNGAVVVDGTAGSLTINSRITGSIGLTVAGNTQSAPGTGGLVILGAATNNYTGPTSISGGRHAGKPTVAGRDSLDVGRRAIHGRHFQS